MSMNVCFSGGASGADVAWGLKAKEAGHDVIHFSFSRHRAGTQENLHILSSEELAVADPHLITASKSLKRSVPFFKPAIANLLRRNWYQINQTERVYAVSKIDPMANSRTGVDGGTAWAIEMAIDHGVPEIHLFDQLKEKWFYWNCARWLEGNLPPKPKGLWTGIGSRDLSDAGLQSIIDVFNQSKI